MHFYLRVACFLGYSGLQKKLKFLNKGGIYSISRSLRDTFIVCGSSLVEMTGDDSSAADTVS